MCDAHILAVRREGRAVASAGWQDAGVSQFGEDVARAFVDGYEG